MTLSSSPSHRKNKPLRVFISSTSADLKAQREIVSKLVLDAQWMPIGMEHFQADPRPIVKLCRDEVRKCDLVVLILAFRRGFVPDADQGGDGVQSITAWEVDAADSHTPPIPVLAFLANDDWPRRLSDLDSDAVDWIQSFRAELNRNAKFFAYEEGDLPQFRSLVREALAIWRERLNDADSETDGAEHVEHPPSKLESTSTVGTQRRWIQMTIAVIVLALLIVAVYQYVDRRPSVDFENGTFVRGTETVFPDGAPFDYPAPTLSVPTQDGETRISMAGGTGGDEVKSDCPRGTAVIGFNGTRSRSMLNGIGLICGSPEIAVHAKNGPMVNVQRRESQSFFGGDVDPPPEPLKTLCEDGGYVTGVEVETRPVMGPDDIGQMIPLGPYVTRVSATCSRLEVSSIREEAPIVTASKVIPMGVEGRPRKLTNFACPSGAVVVGLAGRASAYVDALAFKCGRVLLRY